MYYWQAIQGRGHACSQLTFGSQISKILQESLNVLLTSCLTWSVFAVNCGVASRQSLQLDKQWPSWNVLLTSSLALKTTGIWEFKCATDKQFSVSGEHVTIDWPHMINVLLTSNSGSRTRLFPINIRQPNKQNITGEFKCATDKLFNVIGICC